MSLDVPCSIITDNDVAWSIALAVDVAINLVHERVRSLEQIVSRAVEQFAKNLPVDVAERFIMKSTLDVHHWSITLAVDVTINLVHERVRSLEQIVSRAMEQFAKNLLVDVAERFIMKSTVDVHHCKHPYHRTVAEPHFSCCQHCSMVNVKGLP